MLSRIFDISGSEYSRENREYELDVSVIIPTYNRSVLLLPLIECLREVHKATEYRYEIIFSDDGSSDDTVAVLKNVIDLPLVVLQNEHGGAAKARNNAISVARGEKLLIIGDDIFPNPQIINQHYRKLKELPVCKAVLGNIIWHKDITPNVLMKHITEIGQEQFSFSSLKEHGYVDFRHFYTCNISIDRDFLLSEDIIFDERFYKYNFEDIELGYRLAKKGMQIYFYPEACGEHHHSYRDVRKFCTRQEVAGEMALVFKKLHNEVEYLVCTDSIVHKWKKYLNHFRPTNLNIEDIIAVCQHVEDSGVKGNELEEHLSVIYRTLFRFFYEKGVVSKEINPDDKVLSFIFAERYLNDIISALAFINSFAPSAAFDSVVGAYAEIVGVRLYISSKDDIYLNELRKVYSGLPGVLVFGDVCGTGYVYSPRIGFEISRLSIMQLLVFIGSGASVGRIILSRGLGSFKETGTIGGEVDIVYNTDDTIKSFKVLRLFSEQRDGTSANYATVDEHGFSVGINKKKLLPLPLSFPVKREKPTVFVIPSILAVGGVERNTAEIVSTLKDRYNFIAITFENHRPEQGSLHRVFEQLCDGVFDIWELAQRENFITVLKMLKDIYKPQIVWICNGCPWLAENTVTLRQLFSDSAVVDQQVYDTEAGWVQLYKRRDKGLFSFDRYIAINSKIRETFISCGIKEEDVDLIYSVLAMEKRSSALELSREEKCNKLGLDPAYKYFVFIGRLTAQKAPLDIVLLSAKIKEKFGDDYRFIMAGNGELNAAVDELINEQELSDYIIRFEFVQNTFELSSIAEAIVFTSLYEGLSIALLEALSVGTPGISTNVGDTMLVFEKYKNGVCFEKTGEIDSYLDSFTKFIANYAYIKKNAEMNKHRIAEDFCTEKISLQYVQCFNKALIHLRNTGK
ncbi:glycosyltransferase [Seleniivibrio sp.]|uniref:glycosyltransferase n=1 Tax=Seleniivibrio sp. TaxID=2898801 RepID=UPI0025E627ED|nr:glycosyltransferase [Seleniivibrio sp.]MCD8554002.1 glycosyltransferase [Seleniivibrio sp.]